MKRRTFLGTAAAGAVVGSAAQAQKSDDTLRVTWRDAVPDVDPYRNSLRTGIIVSHEAWDMLVYRDPNTFKIVPALATSWTFSDPTTLDFTLRPGVKFHNGDPFSADDVVYTFNTIISDPKTSVPSNFAFIAGAEKLGDLKVRIKLKTVFPAALEYFAMALPIYPKAYREKVGGAEYSQKPIGTGPYRITRVNGSSEIDMERFEDYYKDSPKGRAAIKYLKINQVLDAAGELTAFISGQADWIWQYNPDQFDNLKMLPGKTAIRAGSMRIGYLQLDAAGRTGAGNPLTKQKVRQAICHAIDRHAIAHDLVQGDSHPIDAPCYPTQFGCDAKAAIDYDYDPKLAKQLLTEAGYPNGFSTSLVTYLLSSFSAAVQNYLKVIGITADIQQLQVGAEIQKVMAGQTPMNFGTWGSYSINDVSAILPYFFGGGANDYARDPQVTADVKQGGLVIDPEDRIKHYSAAIKRVTEQAYWLPMFTSVTQYAFAKNLKFTPFPDELPRFYLCAWV
ncbi:MAG TPA: ABC transporter substrate-binding protein [Rhodopila sp.]|jgi:peptide/nickel transport system substrate-binding protein|nr:ABC transporter substrate-binding protein [Rhodopila sp.]